ncbi:MAG TPA: hypothetical protein VM324_11625 [Egibacteraceae bacterium]|nr:hypothetical protein [Egibacteraceae bacterium]
MISRAGRCERGGVALLTLLAAMVCTAVALALVAAAVDVAHTAARGRAAADAAALAAAGASPLAGGDGDALAAGRRLAVANGARLVACCTATDVPGVARSDPDRRASPWPAGRRPTGGPPGRDRAWQPSPVSVVEVAVTPRLRALRGLELRARAAAGLRPADGPAPLPPLVSRREALSARVPRPPPEGRDGRRAATITRIP